MWEGKGCFFSLVFPSNIIRYREYYFLPKVYVYIECVQRMIGCSVCL